MFIETLYSTHGAQPRQGVCTARRQSTPYVHGTCRPGISRKPMQQHIQSPGACVIWRARIDKCMASGAPADTQTYSASRLLRYSVAISRRHVGPLLYSTSRRLPLPTWPSIFRKDPGIKTRARMVVCDTRRTCDSDAPRRACDSGL